jgi:hypothetical protein
VLKHNFSSPSAQFRGKPFWSWNARLDTKELLRQINAVAEMGMGGFFMHSRTGLATPYLGPAWLKAVEACTQEAEKLGLEAWLYDEDRWPSGAAGGLATRDPKFRMRYLRCNVLNIDEYQRPTNDSFVAAFAATINGINLDSYRPVTLTKAAPKLKSGERLLLFTTELVHTHDFFNGAAYLNTIDRKCVDRFIDFTHERYKKSSGRHFGESIPGIFTDEPHHGFVMCDSPQGWVYPVNSGWATPWSDGLPAYFQKRFGYDFRQRLPEFFFRLHGERFSPVKWQYMEVLHSLFLDNFAGPINDWCNQHRLKFTGHVLAEDLPGSMSVTNGSVMRFYERMGAPGMDLLNLFDRSFWTAKQVASTSRQFGQKWLLSELYGCTGWQMDFAGHKRIGDWQAFLGINLRCHHLAWYSMAGEAKRDYPASIWFQSAWFREYRMVEEYYARIGLLMQQGKAACDLLVLHPVESVWAQVHARWATWIKNQSPDIAPIDDNFKTVCQWILGAQLDFDYGDEEQLGRLGRIAKDSRLRLGLASYRTVLVAGMETMRSSTLEILRKFQQAGGKVIFAGDPPRYVDAVPSAVPTQLSRETIHLPFQRAPLVKALRKAAPPLVEVANVATTDETLPVILQVREDKGAWTVALCNTDPNRTFPNVRVKFNGAGAQVQEWDCKTGQVHLQPHRTSRRALSWTTSLPPIGERVFRIVAKPDRALKPVLPTRTKKVRKVTGPFPYQLDEPNALVIDRFEWRTRGQWQPTTDILVIDDAIRDRIGLKRRTGAMIQPWARKKPAKPLTIPVQLKTSFTIRDLPEGPVHVLMEQPSEWTIKLNGKPVPTQRDDGWFVDPCFRKIPLPAKALKKGSNLLEFTATFAEDLNLEAIYLLGTFGVHAANTKRPFLGKLPAALKLGDVCAQGLPFYSGRIRYILPFPAGAKRLRLPAFGGAVACIKESSGNAQIAGFPPYEITLPESMRGQPTIDLEIVLTRRNLFGPLHLVPKEQFHYGPATFRSVPAFFDAGKMSTTSYSIIPQFFPAGLLDAPEFSLV